MGLGGLFAGGIPRLPNKGAKFGGGFFSPKEVWLRQVLLY
jgi:hypothetical protein